jgi:hypothetical protein
MKPKFIAYAAAREIHNNIMAVLEGKPQTREYTEYLTRAGGSPVYHSTPRVEKPAKGMIPNVDGWSTTGSKGTSIVFTHKALDSYCTITVTPSKVIFSPYVFAKGNRVRINRLMRALGMGDQLYFRMEHTSYKRDWRVHTFIDDPTPNDWYRVHAYSYMGKGKLCNSCVTRFAGDTIEYNFKTGGVVAVTPTSSSGRKAQFVMRGYNHADITFNDNAQSVRIPVPEFVDMVCDAVSTIYDLGVQDEAYERSHTAQLSVAAMSMAAFIDRVVRIIKDSSKFDRVPVYRSIIKKTTKDLLHTLQITHKQSQLIAYTPLEGDGIPRGAREYVAEDAKLVLVPCV